MLVDPNDEVELDAGLPNGGFQADEASPPPTPPPAPPSPPPPSPPTSDDPIYAQPNKTSTNT